MDAFRPQEPALGRIERNPIHPGYKAQLAFAGDRVSAVFSRRPERTDVLAQDLSGLRLDFLDRIELVRRVGTPVGKVGEAQERVPVLRLDRGASEDRKLNVLVSNSGCRRGRDRRLRGPCFVGSPALRILFFLFFLSPLRLPGFFLPSRLFSFPLPRIFGFFPPPRFCGFFPAFRLFGFLLALRLGREPLRFIFLSDALLLRCALLRFLRFLLSAFLVFSAFLLLFALLLLALFFGTPLRLFDKSLRLFLLPAPLLFRRARFGEEPRLLFPLFLLAPFLVVTRLFFRLLARLFLGQRLFSGRALCLLCATKFLETFVLRGDLPLNRFELVLKFLKRLGDELVPGAEFAERCQGILMRT